MCLEDLRLGRGRYVKRTFNGATANNPILLPDATRVAILVSWSAPQYYDQTTTIYERTYQFLYGTPAPTTGKQFAVLGPNNGNLLLDIEHYGQLVTGYVSTDDNSTSGTFYLYITEICTEVNAPPLDTYKP